MSNGMRWTQEQYAAFTRKRVGEIIERKARAIVATSEPMRLLSSGSTMRTIRLRLPWPVSLNKLYTSAANHGRKILSEAGRTYREHCVGLVRTQLAGQCARGRLMVTVTLCEPDRRARDVDNYVKLPLDCCTKAGAWLDDSTIDRLVVQRGALAQGEPHLIIEIQEIGE